MPSGPAKGECTMPTGVTEIDMAEVLTSWSERSPESCAIRTSVYLRQLLRSGAPVRGSDGSTRRRQGSATYPHHVGHLQPFAPQAEQDNGSSRRQGATRGDTTFPAS